MPSRLFVTDPPVPVYEFDPAQVISTTPPSVIYIRARMDVETSGKVSSELVKLGDDRAIESHLGANQTALLVHNIVRWEGPLFLETDADNQPLLDGQGRTIPIRCTPENIRKLDPNDPFIADVLEEIARRNRKRESPKGASATTNGATSAGVGDSIASPPNPANNDSVSLQLATGRSRSSLLTAVAGHRNRSDDLIPTT